MPFANNAGIRIHYEIEGEGPTLLVHHGSTQDLQRWHQIGLVRALAADYRLVLMDARGHGKSDKPHEVSSYTWDLLIGDVMSVADGVSEDRINFMGYSLGGVCAYFLAKLAGERVNSLVIGGAGTVAARFEAFRGVDGSDPEHFIAAFESTVGETMSPEGKARLLANDIEALAAMLNARRDEASIIEVPASIQVPALVYAGESDSIFTNAKACAQQMPNCRFIALPNCSHLECFVKTPSVVPQIRELLNRATH